MSTKKTDYLKKYNPYKSCDIIPISNVFSKISLILFRTFNTVERVVEGRAESQILSRKKYK